MARTLHQATLRPRDDLQICTSDRVTTPVEQGIIRYGDVPSSNGIRLLCCPHAGGGAATYFPWWKQLGPDIEVCALVSPRRDPRSRNGTGAESIEALADDLTATVHPLTDRPFAIFGHSVGAALAYEISVRLSNDGRPPAHLFVAARGAPNTTPPGPRLADLSDDALVAGLRARYDAIPRQIFGDPDLLALFLPSLRADMRRHEQYCAPCRPLSCAITVLGGADDTYVRESDLDAWRDFTRARFERHTMPGGHFFVREALEQTLAVIAKALRPEVVVHE